MTWNENFIDVVVAGIGIILSYFFGEFDGLFIALIVFTTIDYISGVTSAKYNFLTSVKCLLNNFRLYLSF